MEGSGMKIIKNTFLKRTLILILVLIIGLVGNIYFYRTNILDFNYVKFTEETHFQNSWLQEIFTTPNKCTPKNLYYDKNLNASVDKIMEEKGYLPYSIDDQLAKYKIHESFYGLKAIELAIPSETDSIYAVTINSNAATLAKNIKTKTGVTLNIYSPTMKVKSGEAYIVPDSTTTSTYICFTFEE
jgi:hypothetical protein